MKDFLKGLVGKLLASGAAKAALQKLIILAVSALCAFLASKLGVPVPGMEDIEKFAAFLAGALAGGATHFFVVDVPKALKPAPLPKEEAIKDVNDALKELNK